MKNFIERQFNSEYSMGINNFSQNHEYQLNQYKCQSPIVFGNRFASPSPFRSVTPMQGQLSPANQSRRESAFSRNSDNYDFSVKEKSKIITKSTQQQITKQIELENDDEDIEMFFKRQQIMIDEQETLHAKMRMIRDDFNFKIQQLEDQYLRERQSIMQNLTIQIKEEQDRFNEQLQYKNRKNKNNEQHTRTDSQQRQDYRIDHISCNFQQEITRATTSMKEQRPDSKLEKRYYDSRRESRHESLTGFSSHHKRESSHKVVQLRESRMKREESIKGDSLKDEQPLKSALKKRDTNRQTYNYNEDSQDDWKFIKEAKTNLEKQKTQLDEKQSPNKVRFVKNNEKSSNKKSQEKNNIKSKFINDIEIFLKCRY